MVDAEMRKEEFLNSLDAAPAYSLFDSHEDLFCELASLSNMTVSPAVVGSLSAEGLLELAGCCGAEKIQLLSDPPKMMVSVPPGNKLAREFVLCAPISDVLFSDLQNVSAPQIPVQALK